MNTYDPEAALNSPRLVEELASIEHERWSHWQRFLHSQCEQQVDGALTIPPNLVSRWTQQMNMPYAELPETEKDSDREQVRRYLPTIAQALKNRP